MPSCHPFFLQVYRFLVSLRPGSWWPQSQPCWKYEMHWLNIETSFASEGTTHRKLMRAFSLSSWKGHGTDASLRSLCNFKKAGFVSSAIPHDKSRLGSTVLATVTSKCPLQVFGKGILGLLVVNISAPCGATSPHSLLFVEVPCDNDLLSPYCSFALSIQ